MVSHRLEAERRVIKCLNLINTFNYKNILVDPDYRSIETINTHKTAPRKNLKDKFH